MSAAAKVLVRRARANDGTLNLAATAANAPAPVQALRGMLDAANSIPAGIAYVQSNVLVLTANPAEIATILGE